MAAFKCSVCGKEKGLNERFFGSKCKPCYNEYIFKNAIPLSQHELWESEKPRPPSEFVKFRSPEGYAFQLKMYEKNLEEWRKNEPPLEGEKENSLEN